MKSAIKTLREHNEWRRGADTDQGSPMMIGLAIDDCIKAAERYELVRTLTPREFKQLFQENISMGTGFDNLVDILVEARKR
jgi:hypothetical protein